MSPIRVAFVSFIVITMLSACYRSELGDGTGEICLIEGGEAMVLLRYEIEGRGSAHYPGIKRYKYSSYDVLRFPAAQRLAAGSKVLLLRYQGKWPVGPVKGDIHLMENHLRVGLEMPVYDGEVLVGWKPYPLNGTYVLEDAPDNCVEFIARTPALD
jgi:hypothetical protein